MKIQSISRLLLIAFLPASLALSGCANMKNGGGGAGSDSDYVSGTPLPSRQDGVSYFGNNVDKQKFSPVYFGYDSFDVDSSEQGKLEQVAEALDGLSYDTVILAGFTDERGTPEYNRGLGERRALAVRDALLSLGVGSDKMQTVSFGEEMPVSSDAGEGAWARNRRVEFGVVR